MATEAYTIYSQYDPSERENLEGETGQLEEIESKFAWESNRHFGSQCRRPPPHFIPAFRSLDGLDNDVPSKKLPRNTKHAESSSFNGSELYLWYRTLTSESATKTPLTQKMAKHLEHKDTLPGTYSYVGERRNENNWFITKALQSEDIPPPPPYYPTLGDIIARNPPPMPTEEKFKPPVWLAIGPSNKGFRMLQKTGWNEGEPLGPDVVRHHHQSLENVIKLDLENVEREKQREDSSKHKGVELKFCHNRDPCEPRQVDVIDLTSSDSDPEDEGDLIPIPYIPETKNCTHEERTRHSDPTRRALITPIATILKSDRLGIGFKAKTVGPFRTSQKRVTHNAATLAAHIKAAEVSRKRKQLLGRGKRGFAKQQKGDELERKRLLAYLNN